MYKRGHFESNCSRMWPRYEVTSFKSFEIKIIHTERH